MGSTTRAFRLRLSRFELLEPRQMLSGSSIPLGYTPAQIRHAYGFDKILLPGGVVGDGRGTTIAIVDAGNDPTIVSDVAAFSTQFGLQQFNVPGGPTFKVVNQHGSSNPALLPSDDKGTAGETALDVDWAHAVAPGANILLVEVLKSLYFPK